MRSILAKTLCCSFSIYPGFGYLLIPKHQSPIGRRHASARRTPPKPKGRSSYLIRNSAQNPPPTMGLRDILKKKSTLEASDPDPATVSRLAGPEFTFVRSDTYTHEVIHPPQYPDGDDDGGDDAGGGTYLTARDKEKDKSSHRLSLDVFRGSRSRSASASSHGTAGGGGNKESSSSAGGAARRLSHRLHLARSPTSSEMVPQDLPAIVTHRAPDGREDRDGTESQWEKRATMLARENEKHRSRPPTPVGGGGVEDQLGRMRLGSPGEQGRGGGAGGPAVPVVVAGPDDGVVSSKAIDEDIQEAIRLHEEGDLQRSTALFARLADPKGANNPLSQVLYGLALR